MDETHGWGIFGSIGFSDANPTPLGGGGFIGVGGNSPIPGRKEDRFGLGYFYYWFSDDLVNAIAPLVDINPEQGVEAFYNFHVAPGVYLSTDLQVVDPAIGDDTAVFGGFRLQTIF
jgi:porin